LKKKITDLRAKIQADKKKQLVHLENSTVEWKSKVTKLTEILNNVQTIAS
jgi:hypothetical protein